MMSEGYSEMGEFFQMFKTHPRLNPVDSIPSISTNLKALPADSNLIVWFGHSSFYIQLDGKKILGDPIFSKRATPLPWGSNAYNGTTTYSVQDLPQIDYVIISHDHYDHLDYETMLALKDKVKYVVCGLGVGEHLERWGYKPEQIIEKDWYEKVEIAKGYHIYTLPAHHDLGRATKWNQALWMSFLISSPSMKIYYSGDGGYTKQFAEIAEKYGPIDWAIVECGQYNVAWESIHLPTEKVRQVAIDLKAKNLLPVHNSKFSEAKHPWDEPLIQITELSKSQSYRLATPLIGEVIRLNDSTQVFTQWWKGIK